MAILPLLGSCARLNQGPPLLLIHHQIPGPQLDTILLITTLPPLPPRPLLRQPDVAVLALAKIVLGSSAAEVLPPLPLPRLRSAGQPT